MQFLVVYIREAHALDGRAPMTILGDPVVEEPLDLSEREAICRHCMARTAFGELPNVVDGMDDAVAKAYAAAPDRLYLVAKDGKIAYRGGRGPFGFRPDELEDAIRREIGLADDLAP